MVLQHKLQTPEATYYLDIYESITGIGECAHFVLDCPCGGKNGSRYKNARESTLQLLEGYEPFYSQPQQHTFYMNAYIFSTQLENEHEDTPLIIICTTCTREFPFTHESYKTLSKKIREEGTTTDLPE